MREEPVRKRLGRTTDTTEAGTFSQIQRLDNERLTEWRTEEERVNDEYVSGSLTYSVENTDKRGLNLVSRERGLDVILDLCLKILFEPQAGHDKGPDGSVE